MRDLIYRGDSCFTYATSIAATWVWAPAIFVASSMAYFNGLYGFLWFLIPNILTLIVFGYFAQRFVREKGYDSFVGLTDLFFDTRQERLHSIVSYVLMLASLSVQLVGLNILINTFFPSIPIHISTICVSLFCYLYTKIGGIKLCIISDSWKYYTMLGVGILLLGNLLYNGVDFSHLTFYGINKPEFMSMSLSFGVITAIGLFSAPYVDNTFWQRVFSIDKTNILKTFSYSAVFFGLIPLVFGMIGFLSTNVSNSGWVITQVFSNSTILTLLLCFAIFLALIATIDSVLCACYSLTTKEFPKFNSISMEVLLTLGTMLVIIFEPTIVDLFLLYGTIRTATAIPTVLTICERYNKDRLFYSTLIAVLVGSFGYLTMALLNLPYGYIFTIFAFLVPLLGYSKSVDKYSDVVL